MSDKINQNKVKKGFFARMIDKIDKKMQEKAKAESCCCGGDKTDKKSCCS